MDLICIFYPPTSAPNWESLSNLPNTPGKFKIRSNLCGWLLLLKWMKSKHKPELHTVWRLLREAESIQSPLYRGQTLTLPKARPQKRIKAGIKDQREWRIASVLLIPLIPSTVRVSCQQKHSNYLLFLITSSSNLSLEMLLQTSGSESATCLGQVSCRRTQWPTQSHRVTFPGGRLSKWNTADVWWTSLSVLCTQAFPWVHRPFSLPLGHYLCQIWISELVPHHPVQ